MSLMQANLFDNQNALPSATKPENGCNLTQPDIVHTYLSAIAAFKENQNLIKRAASIFEQDLNMWTADELVRCMGKDEDALTRLATSDVITCAVTDAVDGKFEPKINWGSEVDTMDNLDPAALYNDTHSEWILKAASYPNHVAAKHLSSQIPKDKSRYSCEWNDKLSRYKLHLSIRNYSNSEKLVINYQTSVYEFVEALTRAADESSTNVLDSLVKDMSHYVGVLNSVFNRDSGTAASTIKVNAIDAKVLITEEQMKEIELFIEHYRGREHYY